MLSSPCVNEQASDNRLLLPLLSSQNQQRLCIQIFRAAATDRRVTKPRQVIDRATREFTRRCLQSMGQIDGAAYGRTLEVLRDYPDAALLFAQDALRAAGKSVSGKSGGLF